jgi:hypothetical protein
LKSRTFNGGRWEREDVAMKGLLFLGLVGAAIYALLVYTHHVLPAPLAQPRSASTRRHSKNKLTWFSLPEATGL